MVVGATSRPDLIDAALLRPGRLDRMVHCGFPSTSEREEVLHVLARHLQLADRDTLQQACALPTSLAHPSCNLVKDVGRECSVHTRLAQSARLETQSLARAAGARLGISSARLGISST
jgi:peroxin-1